MFYLLGKENIIRNVALLCASSGNSQPSTVEELRTQYLKYLSDYHGDDTVPLKGEDKYLYDLEKIQKQLSKFEAKCALTDLKTTTEATKLSSMEAALSEIKLGIEYMGKISPDLRSVFDFAIHTLFYFRSEDSGGGSVSSAIGTIWCANRTKWTKQDVSEFLVHELAHNLVFVDELRYQHYKDLELMVNVDNFAKSTILKKQRPLDKVFHSLIVGYEILKYREQTGEPENPLAHPSSNEIIVACKETITSINKAIQEKDLVTDRFKELVNMISNDIYALKNVA